MVRKARAFCAVSLAVGLFSCALAPHSLHAAPIATSTFSSNAEGWAVVSTIGYYGSPTYSPTGGNPGGYIYAVDPDTGAWGFAAPSKFLGNVSAAYGQPFSFDIAAYNTPEHATAWVGIQGAGYQFICLYDAPASASTWYSRSVSMTETAGWVDPDTQMPPTYAEMMAVLSSLDGLVITAEFLEGLENDISGLDNVVLTPEPTTLMLLAVAVPVLMRSRWRRKR
jgi:hypothetical protein